MTDNPSPIDDPEQGSTDILGHESSTDELGHESSTDIIGHEQHRHHRPREQHRRTPPRFRLRHCLTHSELSRPIRVTGEPG